MRFFSSLLCALLAECSISAPFTVTHDHTVIVSPKRWLSLPATPKFAAAQLGKYANVNGIKLWYNIYGEKNHKRIPVVFLHGGLGSSDYFGNQVEALSKDFRVITIDTRGHGRSGRDKTPFGYELFSNDFVELLNLLNVPKAAFVGWSDGAICVLDIAKRFPNFVDRGFAFSANYDISGVMDVTKSPVFMTYINRTVLEYERLNPHPDDYGSFLAQIQEMWSTQPNWKQQDFANINGSNIWIVDGDHEEAVKRIQQDDMARWMPEAGQLILPQVSHFAFIQDPNTFTGVLRRFLDLPM